MVYPLIPPIHVHVHVNVHSTFINLRFQPYAPSTPKWWWFMTLVSICNGLVTFLNISYLFIQCISKYMYTCRKQTRTASKIWKQCEFVSIRTCIWNPNTCKMYVYMYVLGTNPYYMYTCTCICRLEVTLVDRSQVDHGIRAYSVPFQLRHMRRLHFYARKWSWTAKRQPTRRAMFHNVSSHVQCLASGGHQAHRPQLH